MSSTLLLFSILITLLLLTTTTLAHPRPAETQPIPDCPIANSRRLNNPKRAASYTNPALCTIAGPYPQTTYSFTPSASSLDGSSLSGSGLYSIVLPTATLVGSGGQSTVIGGSTVVLTNTPASTTTMGSGTTASGNGTQPSLTPTSTTASTSASASTAAAAITTAATGAGARRANTPTSFKSIQRFSGLQISLTLFLGVGVLAGIIYFLDELLDVLV
ncbi:hypothetical protein A4X13_0g3711 [Tilletia indica]|uniref:Uncharacterized protein n=1 Tax=Tilletia indica TaxID=43049 RepID=A0A177TE89_9BASI|nr:hypothetical protein A4X13_0g3711 [Tilletia indica]